MNIINVPYKSLNTRARLILIGTRISVTATYIIHTIEKHECPLIIHAECNAIQAYLCGFLLYGVVVSLNGYTGIYSHYK